jgi:hypothetical protein
MLPFRPLFRCAYRKRRVEWSKTILFVMSWFAWRKQAGCNLLSARDLRESTVPHTCRVFVPWTLAFFALVLDLWLFGSGMQQPLLFFMGASNLHRVSLPSALLVAAA